MSTRVSTDDGAGSALALGMVAATLPVQWLLPLAILTGLAMSPGADAAMPFLTRLPGGRQSARSLHFLCAVGLTVNCTVRDGKESMEGRYYILSRKLTAKQFAEAVRGHWSIENSLHWQLDVTFGEDQCRLRQGHADANFSLLRRHALSLLKAERTAKCGVKNKRLSAGWNETYLLKVLLGS